MNKRGYSISGWIEGIAFSIIIVIALGLVFTDMNEIHSKNYTLGLSVSDQIQKLTNLQSQTQNKTVEGEATFGADSGITLTSSWDMVVTAFTIIGQVLGGSWIMSLSNYMMMPPMVGMIIRTLWLLSLVFIIIKILFKVRV